MDVNDLLRLEDADLAYNFRRFNVNNVRRLNRRLSVGQLLCEQYQLYCDALLGGNLQLDANFALRCDAATVTVGRQAARGGQLSRGANERSREASLCEYSFHILILRILFVPVLVQNVRD